MTTTPNSLFGFSAGLSSTHGTELLTSGNDFAGSTFQILADLFVLFPDNFTPGILSLQGLLGGWLIAGRCTCSSTNSLSLAQRNSRMHT